MNINCRIYLVLQKRLYPLLFCWFIALYALYFYLLSDIPFFYESSFTPLLFLGAGFALFYLLLLRFMKYQTDKINSILNDDCDPQTFTGVYRDMLRESANIKRRVNSGFIRNNIATGLAASGEYQEALDLLSGITINTATRAGKIIAMIYHHNICSVLINLGDLEKAESRLNEIQKLLGGLKVNSKRKKVYETRLSVTQTRLNMSKGNYDNAESVFSEAFEHAKSRNEKVNMRFFLGQVYLYNRDTQHAREAFEYVVSHGNKLHVVEEAKDQLARFQFI